MLVRALTPLALLGVVQFSAAPSIAISHHAFVQLCKNMGGTPTRVSTYVVNCVYPDCSLTDMP